METKELAKQIRIKVLQMVHKANASHIGGAYSMADILAVLYNEIINIDVLDYKNPERDRFFLSKGHSCAGLYAVLGLKNFFPIDELDTYAQDGSKFISHVSHHIPGVEASSGSLGHILPIACGVAYSAKINQQKFKIYCLLSDGELNEGSNWEPIMLAPQHKLSNLVLIIDYNKIQSLGAVKDIIDLEPLRAKFEAFRWNVHEVDGHDTPKLSELFKSINSNISEIPNVVIAHTIKGKGVDFMENKLLWHYRSPDKELFDAAYNQLTNSSL
jgi:transketolase